MTESTRQKVSAALIAARKLIDADLDNCIESFCPCDEEGGRDETSLGAVELELLDECRSALAMIAEAQEALKGDAP